MGALFALGGVCLALVKVAVAQTQDLCTVSIHGRRCGGAAFSQTKQSSSTSALWDHAEMEGSWNPSNPIVHLRMWGTEMFFGDKKLLLGKKCQKFFHPALETGFSHPTGTRLVKAVAILAL